jgi:predicted lipid-binding transport protein (Tim44 family)
LQALELIIFAALAAVVLFQLYAVLGRRVGRQPEGDRPTLQNLLTPGVYSTFDSALATREAEGRSETTEFLQAPRADLEDVSLVGDMARVKVRFLAEFRTRSKGPEGEAVDDRRTAEIWTFERNVNSRDPNWALAQVEPAEV